MDKSIRETSMMGSDDTGRNYCFCCGHSWQTKRRWLYWPIRLSRQPNLGQRKYEQRRWAIWGWQVGADRMSQPVFGWTVRIWRLLIKFGDMKAKMRCRYDGKYGVWIDNRLKERERSKIISKSPPSYPLSVLDLGSTIIFDPEANKGSASLEPAKEPNADSP